MSLGRMVSVNQRPMNTIVPDPGHRCWMRLAAGSLCRLQTRHLSLQLLNKRLQGDPGSLEHKAAEIHAFFVKYAAILGPEIQQLNSL